MARSRRTLNDSRADSPDSAEDSSPARSPQELKGGSGKLIQDEVDSQVLSEMSK
jgi:hypothetical protein